MSISDTSVGDTPVAPVPLNIRAGLAYKLETIAEMSTQGAVVSNLLKGSLGTFEIASRNDAIYIRTGVEVWLNQSIAVRGGYGLKNGSNSATTLSFGGSAKLPISKTAIQLDYGFQLLSGDFQDNITQRFSVNLLF